LRVSNVARALRAAVTDEEVAALRGTASEKRL
jgi:hypothetical protein